MSVSYDTSSLLKCTVSMSYIRYILKGIKAPGTGNIPDFGRRAFAANPDIPFSFNANYGDIYDSGVINAYASNLNVNPFTAEGQANFNFAFSQGLNLDITPPQ